jgi:hypothetical protein
LAVLLSLPLGGVPVSAADALSHSDAYKGIVEIVLFSLDESNNLSKISSGSGILINESGLILTNHHVISHQDSFDDSEKEVAFQVCLTNDKNEAPDCAYTANFIASDEDRDVALLKMESINGLSSKTSFPYLDLADSSIQTGADLTILGYPGSGGDTITITEGVVSGKTEESDLDWIKTDAYVSFGNSGGAGINEDGEVVGITSKGNGLGYLLDLESFSGWVEDNQSKALQTSALKNQLIAFTKKEKSLEDSNDFSDVKSLFSITKPSDWDFSYDSEDGIYASDDDDYDAGYVKASVASFPFLLDNEDISWIFKIANPDSYIFLDIIKEETIEVEGGEGRLFTYSVLGEIGKQYLFVNGNHIIELTYDYGEKDVDKAKVEEMIGSFKLLATSTGPEPMESCTDPKTGITIDFEDSPWIGEKVNSVSSPFVAYHSEYKNVILNLSIGKRDSDEMELSNNQIYKLILEEDESFNSSDFMEIKLETIDAASYASVNDVINDAIMKEQVMSRKDKASIKVLSYSIFHEDLEYTIGILQIGSEGDYEKAKADLMQTLKKFKIEGYKSQTISEEVMRYKATDEDSDADKDEGTATTGDIDTNEDNNTIPTSNSGQNNLKVDNTPKKEMLKNKAMHERLKGKIMIKVQDSGKAYYIHPQKDEMFYLGRPDDAFQVMRSQGIGISNANLEKIPVSTDSQGGSDSDNDGLSDLFEDAIGTDKNKADSDGDGYNDMTELKNGYSPRGGGVLNHDLNFSNSHKGKIFLQIEGKGEAWYVNPANGKRYFLGRPADAFNVMRSLGLGISDSDFQKMMQ